MSDLAGLPTPGLQLLPSGPQDFRRPSHDGPPTPQTAGLPLAVQRQAVVNAYHTRMDICQQELNGYHVLVDERNRAVEENGQLRNRVNHWYTRGNQISQENAQLKKDFEIIQDKLDNETNLRHDAEKRNNELSKRSDALNQAKSGLQSSIRGLEEVRDAVFEQMAQQRREIDAKEASWEAERVALTGAKDEVEEALAAQQKERLEIQDSNDTLLANIEALQLEIGVLKDEKAAADRRADTAECLVGEIQLGLNNVARENARLEVARRSHSTALTLAYNARDGLAEAVVRSEGKKDTLSDSLREAHSMVATLTAEKHTQASEIVSFQDRIAALKSDVTQKEKDLGLGEKREAKLLRDLRTAQDDKDTVAKRMNKAQVEAGQHKNALKKKEEAVERLEEEARQLNRHCYKISQERDTAISERDAVKLQKKSRDREVERLKTVVEELRQDLTQREEELVEAKKEIVEGKEQLVEARKVANDLHEHYNSGASIFKSAKKMTPKAEDNLRDGKGIAGTGEASGPLADTSVKDSTQESQDRATPICANGHPGPASDSDDRSTPNDLPTSRETTSKTALFQLSTPAIPEREDGEVSSQDSSDRISISLVNQGLTNSTLPKQNSPLQTRSTQDRRPSIMRYVPTAPREETTHEGTNWWRKSHKRKRSDDHPGAYRPSMGKPGSGEDYYSPTAHERDRQRDPRRRGRRDSGPFNWTH